MSVENKVVDAKGITKTSTVSPISMNEEKGLYTNQYQKKKTKTVELRQAVTSKSIYPATKVSNSAKDSLFAIEDFGFESNTYDSTENRVAWVSVPEAATIEQVKLMLDKTNATGGTLYRTLSNAPILDEDQLYALTQPGQQTKEGFAAKQAIRYPDGTIVGGADVSGKLVLDPKGNIQYRVINFSSTPRADVDNRGNGDIWISPELEAELNGEGAIHMQNQIIN